MRKPKSRTTRKGEVDLEPGSSQEGSEDAEKLIGEDDDLKDDKMSKIKFVVFCTANISPKVRPSAHLSICR